MSRKRLTSPSPLSKKKIITDCNCTFIKISDVYTAKYFVMLTKQVLSQVGVISGNDITPEAALAKLSYVLSKDDWDLSTKRMVRK